MDTITIRMTSGYSWQRRPCFICGGRTEKDGTYPTWTDPDGDEHFVCEGCLDAGANAAPARLVESAERLEVWTSHLRALAGCEFEMPTRAEYDEALEEADRIYVEADQLLQGGERRAE